MPQQETYARAERDILLAPNEFAYVQDLTKGSIDLSVGPTKISLSNTERLVRYERRSGRFIPLEERVEGQQQFTVASSSQYTVLENPAIEDVKYQRGSNHAVDLVIGKKVVIPGPSTFPLWPGQTASVIDGHRLQEDEYLIIRAYDATEQVEQVPHPQAKGGESPVNVVRKKITIGTEFVVRGFENSFYIPPNGFEVVPKTPQGNDFVRKAVKLMDGEYCVLLNPNGEKKYVKGPNMVIPEPNETFQSFGDRYVSKAYTLKQERGLHLSVTRDFSVSEKDPLSQLIGEGNFRIGQEIFISGKEGLFFPNENMGIIGEVKPVSVAENEGIYVRNIKTGEINTIKGPENYLPNPTTDEIVERTLDDKIMNLTDIKVRDRRKAISIYVKPNHAMMVVSEKGRKVVKGSQTYILGYAEDLEALALSTGTPKTDKTLLETVFLQVEGNKVSDEVNVETQDHVKLNVRVSYRLSFEGESEKWFDVNNYVGLLCDHLSSLVRSAVQRHPLEKFYSNSTEIVRDAVLGEKKEGAKRQGRSFTENGMRVYDLEVLSLNVLDEGIESMLQNAQQSAFKMEMMKREAERKFDLTQSTERIEQETYGIKMTTLEKRRAFLQREGEIKTAEAELGIHIDAIQKTGLARNAVESEIVGYEFGRTKAEEEQERRLILLEAETRAHRERMAAITPDLVAAITRYGDQNLIAEVAKNFGEIAVLEGKSLPDVVMNLLRGLPFAQRGLEALQPLKKA